MFVSIKSNYRRLVWACVIPFVWACGSKKDMATQGPPPPPVVDVLVVGTSQLDEKIEANGTILANESAELHPEIAGRLVLLNMPDGGKVTKGTVLAKINDADLQAQASKIQTQLEIAYKNEERLKKLLEINGITQAEYDNALNTVNTLRADAAIIKAQIDKTVVRAPFDGKLGIRLVSAGAYVTPQTILGNIQQVHKLKIDFTIPETYAPFVTQGQWVTVQTNATTEPLKAQVSAIEPQINLTTRNLKVRAILSSSNITPGAFAKVQIAVGGKKERLIVPSQAIIPEATAKKLVVIKKDTAQFIPVETGLRTAGGVEILKGISVGDSVVITGTLFVRPKTRVKIRSVKSLDVLVK